MDETTTLIITGPVDGRLGPGDIMEIRTTATNITAVNIWDAFHRKKKCQVL